MHGPHPLNHQRAVVRMFGPTAHLAGSLGTPQTPGRVEIHVGTLHLASAPTFAAAIEIATAKAASMAVKC